MAEIKDLLNKIKEADGSSNLPCKKCGSAEVCECQGKKLEKQLEEFLDMLISFRNKFKK